MPRYCAVGEGNISVSRTVTVHAVTFSRSYGERGSMEKGDEAQTMARGKGVRGIGMERRAIRKNHNLDVYPCNAEYPSQSSCISESFQCYLF